MTMQRIGSFAALTCAGAYIFGFVLLFTIMAEAGFGSGSIDAATAVQFTTKHPAIMIVSKTIIYIVNAIALALVVVALAGRLLSVSADWGRTSLAFGLIWTTLLSGAGMLAYVTTERVLALAPTDFGLAVQTWELLHAVELGLGGGNEIVGGG